MTQNFDPISYWKERHQRLRGDARATGNISRSSEQMLQRKLVQSFFFFSLVHAIRDEIRNGKSWLANRGGNDSVRVLDIGFGTGYLGSLLVRSGIDYTGYDVSEIAVEDASRMCPQARYQLSNVVEQPAQRSDIIIASEVLFHIVDDEQWSRALRNVAAGMSCDSIFIFTETFIPKAAANLQHFKPRTLEMYESALERSGLKFVGADDLPISLMPVFSDYEPFRRSTHFVRMADH